MNQPDYEYRLPAIAMRMLQKAGREKKRNILLMTQQSLLLTCFDSDCS